MVTLIPLTAAAFPDFLESAVTMYASQNVAAGRWLPEDAEATARKETEAMLSQGAATPGHFLYSIAADEGAEAVGHLWYTSMQRGASKVAYIVQIVIKPDFQRKGYGRVALREAERLAALDGHSMIALNVFAQNTGARALYDSLGYAVMNTNMAKPLPRSDA